MVRKLAIASALVPLLLLGLITFVSRDAPDPGDAELALPPQAAISPAGDGFAPLVEQIRALDVGASGRERLATAEQGPLAALAPVVDRLAPALAEAAEQLGTHPFQYPPADGIALEDLGEIQVLAGLWLASARLAADRGACPAALRHWRSALQLARRVHAGHAAGLVEGISAVGLRERALRAGPVLLAACPPDDVGAREVAGMLAEHAFSEGDWRGIWAVEYQRLKSAVTQGVAEEFASLDEPAVGSFLPRGYLFQPNRTYRRLAEPYLRVSNLGMTDCTQALPPPAEPGTRWRALLPNGIGWVLSEIARSDFSRYRHRSCREVAASGVLTAAAALGAYERQSGALPERLEALVPALLAALPRDPFAGAALRYDRGERRIWSVGPPHPDSGPGAELSYVLP